MAKHQGPKRKQRIRRSDGIEAAYTVGSDKPTASLPADRRSRVARSGATAAGQGWSPSSEAEAEAYRLAADDLDEMLYGPDLRIAVGRVTAETGHSRDDARDRLVSLFAVRLAACRNDPFPDDQADLLDRTPDIHSDDGPVLTADDRGVDHSAWEPSVAEADTYAAAVEEFEDDWTDGLDALHDIAHGYAVGNADPADTVAFDAEYERAWDRTATFWAQRLQRRHGFAYPKIDLLPTDEAGDSPSPKTQGG